MLFRVSDGWIGKLATDLGLRLNPNRTPTQPRRRLNEELHCSFSLRKAAERVISIKLGTKSSHLRSPFSRWSMQLLDSQARQEYSFPISSYLSHLGQQLSHNLFFSNALLQFALLLTFCHALQAKQIEIPQQASKEKLLTHGIVLNSTYSPCEGPSLLAEYVRNSATPRLLLRVEKGKDICGVVKLSCRLRSNLEAVDIHDLGHGSHRLPVRDWAWGEILSLRLMELSSFASQAMVRGSGAVINRAPQIFGDKKQLESVPLTCWWEGETLLGFLQEYLPGLKKGKVTSKRIQSLEKKEQASLAIIWILDALMLNSDRSNTNNIFANRNDKLVPLDFEKWFQESSSPIPCGHSHLQIELQHKISHVTRSPKCLGKLPACAQEVQPLLSQVERILAEICGGESDMDHCNQGRARLKLLLSQDPWFRFLRDDIRTFHFRPEFLCCDGFTMGPKDRECKPCAQNSNFKVFFQKSLSDDCIGMYKTWDPIDILVDIVFKRVRVVLSTIIATKHDCNDLSS